MGDETMGPALGGSGAKKPKKKLMGVPDLLDYATLRKLFPKTAGCYPWFEKGADRWRGFYTTPAGCRTSCSFGVAEHGAHMACWLVLQWAWRQHVAWTPEECPLEGLI